MVDRLRKFSCHFPLSSKTNHTGPAASRMAARLLGIYCSDQISAPLPSPSNNRPLTIAGRITTQENSFSLVNRHHNNMIVPDSRKRNTPTIIGGICATDIWIKK